MRWPQDEDAASARKKGTGNYWLDDGVEEERPVMAPTPKPATAPARMPISASTRTFSRSEALDLIAASVVLPHHGIRYGVADPGLSE